MLEIGLLLFASVLPALWIINSRAPSPTGLGVTDGLLASCPSSPNCVSSQSDQPSCSIDPLPFTEAPEAAIARLASLVESFPRTRKVQRTADYLHYEVRTLVCRFVDDVEFFADRQAKVIHVRSASRLGYSDLGANRKRVEAIRAAWSNTATVHPR
jgi:uncharacterized protein (DUF1499 family)